MTIFGIDNGVSGTIGVWQDGKVFLYKTPVFSERNYQKTKVKNLNRIDTNKFKDILKGHITEKNIVRLERPMINPGQFEASLSAIRALEATLIVLESLNLRGENFDFIDSKNWQNKLIPFLEGAKDLKQISWIKGNKLYPQFTEFKHPDRDGLLIMHYIKEYLVV